MESLVQKIANQRGFTLTQVMVAVGLSAIVSLGVLEIANQLTVISSRANDKETEVSTIAILRNYLSSETLCQAALSVQKNITSDISDLSDDAGALNNVKIIEIGFNFDVTDAQIGRFEPGVHNSYFDINVEQLYVKNLIQGESGPLGGNIYMGILSGQFSTNRTTSTYYKSKDIAPIRIRTSPTGQIVSCTTGNGTFTYNLPVTTLPQCGQSQSCAAPINNVNRSVYTARNNNQPPSCGNLAACTVVDYFLRNGGTQQQAEAWMKANEPQWQQVALNYRNYLGPIGAINAISSVLGPGLEGIDQKELDLLVADVVGTDPTFATYFATSSGITMANEVFGSRMLNTLLKENPQVVKQGAAGLGTWAQALGYDTVKSFAVDNPELTAQIAVSTGQWTSALNDVPGVTQFIKENPSLSIQIAQGTAIWNELHGNTVVMDHIKNDSGQSAAIARGTMLGNEIFGNDVVRSAIQGNSGESAKIASQLSAAQDMGLTTSQMKDYVEKNPNTWKKDLENFVNKK